MKILQNLTSIFSSVEKYAKKLYYYVTSAIRRKLIVMTSLIILFSVNTLIYIALVIFGKNMTNMIVFLHSKATNILASEVKTKIESYQMKIIDLAQSKASSEEVFKKYTNFFYVAQLSVQPNRALSISKSSMNYNLLSRFKINPSDFMKKINSKQANLLTKEFRIQNVTFWFEKTQQALWLFTIPHNNHIYMSVVNVSDLYDTFSSKTSGSSYSIYTSYLVDFQGNLVLHPEREKLLHIESMLSDPAVEKMYEAKSKNGVFRFQKQEDQYFGSFEKINKVGISVISSIPEKVALEGVNEVRWGSILISILIVSVAILFVYFFSNTISTPLKLLAETAEKVSEGEYAHSLEVATRDELGELTKAFNIMTYGLQEKEKLKGALNKFVNEEITRQVLEGEIKLGGERKEATVFFMDIRGFTAISENMEPEQVVDFLNEYMTLVVHIISRQGGVVDKFIGDSVMAVWGAPVPKENDLINCLNAALLLRQNMIDFNALRKENGKFPILFGCGINTGPVISGQIGSPQRHEYTVIGDTVNLASRVEALSKVFAVDILITENTYNMVKDIFAVFPMKKVKVKGKKEAQKVYTLLGRKDDPHIPKTLEMLRKKIGTIYNRSLASKYETT